MDSATKSDAHAEMAIPIRVRGLSVENKFFDEETETMLVGPQSVVTCLQNLVELETELHVLNLQSNLGGTFRVVWVDTGGKDGLHNLGLELTQAEADLWRIQFADSGEVAGQAEGWIECRRCHQRLKTLIPETRPEFFVEGFPISRPCDRCKATTPWAFSVDPAEETARRTVGETLKVFMPYKEGELGIPVPARVVRRNPVKGSPNHAIAIQLEEAQ